MTWLFLVAVSSSVAAYLALSAVMDRREAAAAVRRVAGRPGPAAARRSSRPMLIQAAGEVRGVWRPACWRGCG